MSITEVERPADYVPSLAGRTAEAPPAPKREPFIGFASDTETALVLHEALAAHLPETCHIHVMDFRASLGILAAMNTPEIVMVDLSGKDQPINAIMELADVVEPGTTVLAIGETQNLQFYRTITKGLGIKEYMVKPLTAANVERNFSPILAGRCEIPVGQRGGRLITLAGARGGVGTSTLATSLAWFIGNCQHRHTVLLDGDLNTGTVALNLNIEHNNGLGTILAVPDRLDHLLVERSTVSGGDRLRVMAAQEPLDRNIDYHHDSAELLIQALRGRYNFVVADAGAKLTPFGRDLCAIAQQRVIVLDPTMVAIRNLERLLTLPASAGQSPKIMTVLNKAGTPGGLSQSYMEQTMGLRFDAVIPDLPRILGKTSQFGEQAAALRGPFRAGIAALAQALGASAISEG